MKSFKVILLAMAVAFAFVSCKKTGPIDNTFKQGDIGYKINFSATVYPEDNHFTATISFPNGGPLYLGQHEVDEIGVGGYLGTHELPKYNYFYWDYEVFESGTAKISEKDGVVTLVVDAKLENGQKLRIRAKSEKR